MSAIATDGKESTVIFEQDQLVNVAKAVLTFNKYLAGDSVENVIASMKQHAHSALQDGTGYVSTGGFDLSAWRDSEGQINVRASVAAYLFSDLPIPPVDA